MSDIDDCVSQEIETSTSSNSTKDSKKHNFVRAILKADGNPTACGQGLRPINSGEKVPRLPLLEKKDFIKNWILAHSNRVDSPEKSEPSSPILGIPTPKRSPPSPILGYQWKRIKKETSAKENCRVSLIEKLRLDCPDLPSTARIKIEDENPRCHPPVERWNNDQDKTLVPENFSVLNEIANCSGLNPSRKSCGFLELDEAKNLGKFDGDSTLKRNDRRSLVRESQRIRESLSLSSPLSKRNQRPIVEKRGRDLSELLAEESLLAYELPSSSPKISQTISDVFDGHRETKNKWRSRIDVEEDFHIRKWRRMHRGIVGLSPIKFEAEDPSSLRCRSRVVKSPNVSDRFSMPSPLKNKNIRNVRYHDSSWIKLDDNSRKSEELKSSRGFNGIQRNSSRSIETENNGWIKVERNIENSETTVGARCNDRPTEIRRSSSSQQGESYAIDTESNATNAPEDEAKIDSASETADVDLIENVETQNLQTFPTNKNFFTTAGGSNLQSNLEKICDSDETYFSDGESLARCPNMEIGLRKNSQKISQSTSRSHEDRVSANRSELIISQAISPVANDNRESQSHVTFVNAIDNDSNKKRRGKKGSLLAKLQSIVNSQVSKFRIWRYQMSRSDFDVSRTQFVALKIIDRETRFGRHYVTASVIEDSHDLLNSLWGSENNFSSEKIVCSSKTNNVTLMMIPEIIGVVKIRAQSTIKIYPPWEIMDRDKKIINVMYFNVIAGEAVLGDDEISMNREKLRIVEEFDCPCIRANALVDSCPVKFRVTKPCFMREIFRS